MKGLAVFVILPCTAFAAGYVSKNANLPGGGQAWQGHSSITFSPSEKELKSLAKEAFTTMEKKCGKDTKKCPTTMSVAFYPSDGKKAGGNLLFHSSIKGGGSYTKSYINACHIDRKSFNGICAEMANMVYAVQKKWSLDKSSFAVYGQLDNKQKGFLSPCSTIMPKKGSDSTGCQRFNEEAQTVCVSGGVEALPFKSESPASKTTSKKGKKPSKQTPGPKAKRLMMGNPPLQPVLEKDVPGAEDFKKKDPKETEETLESDTSPTKEAVESEASPTEEAVDSEASPTEAASEIGSSEPETSMKSGSLDTEPSLASDPPTESGDSSAAESSPPNHTGDSSAEAATATEEVEQSSITDSPSAATSAVAGKFPWSMSCNFPKKADDKKFKVTVTKNKIKKGVTGKEKMLSEKDIAAKNNKGFDQDKGKLEGDSAKSTSKSGSKTKSGTAKSSATSKGKQSATKTNSGAVTSSTGKPKASTSKANGSKVTPAPTPKGDDKGKGKGKGKKNPKRNIPVPRKYLERAAEL